MYKIANAPVIMSGLTFNMFARASYTALSAIPSPQPHSAKIMLKITTNLRIGMMRASSSAGSRSTLLNFQFFQNFRSVLMALSLMHSGQMSV
jgi:hypothetical protein